MPRLASAVLLLLSVSSGLTAADWTDRKEYDLVLTIRSETSPQKRLALLDTWSKGYPSSGQARARLELYLATYESLGDKPRMFETARKMLTGHPGDAVGLYWSALLAPAQPNPSQEVIAAGENAAHTLLNGLDAYFSPDRRPASVADADWQRQRTNVESLAQRTLGWVAWQRGNFPAAEEALGAGLAKDPDNAEIASWLGVVNGLDAGKQVQAIWFLARAARPNSLPLDQARQVTTMLEHVYASYHGSLDGLDQIRTAAAGAAFPPVGFAIDPATVIAARRAEAELSLTNPELAAWLAIRRQLEAPSGETYFTSDLQSKPLPRLKGTVVHSTSGRGPREIVLAMTDAGNSDVTLKIAAGLSFPTGPGTQLLFQGVAESYSRDPFAVVVTSDPGQVETAAKPPRAPRKT